MSARRYPLRRVLRILCIAAAALLAVLAAPLLVMKLFADAGGERRR